MKLAALMDPDSNELGARIGQKEREEELLRYSAFPLYPTGEVTSAIRHALH